MEAKESFLCRMIPTDFIGTEKAEKSIINRKKIVENGLKDNESRTKINWLKIKEIRLVKI